MQRTLPLAIVITLLACSAYGASSPVLAYTFVCKGKQAGTCPDGNGANSLIQGSDGNFYGTAVSSGSKAGGQTLFGGTVFSLTPAGKFTLLYTFAPGAKNNFANGAGPVSLTEGPDGNLYGLTVDGGNDYNPSQFAYGFGVVFRISKTGSGFKVIHKFCSDELYTCKDGVYPVGALLVGTDGNIYGATSEGGTGSHCPGGGCGTIFRVTPSSGAYEVVYSFNLLTDGELPQGLTPASDGSFYGITVNGGRLFHYTPMSEAFDSVALPFPLPQGCPGFACFAASVLSFGPNGNLYGFYTVYDEPGVGLFGIQADGSNLKLFPDAVSFGPELLLASDSNFWYPSVGTSGYGDVISLSPADGKVLQTLSPFSPSAPVGAYPAVLIQAKDGTLWGATSAYGNAPKGDRGSGTIFSLSAGLPPR